MSRPPKKAVFKVAALKAKAEAETERQVGISQTQREITEVCDELRDFLLDKNRAYGDSALQPARVFSRADTVEQIKVRLDDKISRLQHGHALPDESLADTIRDLMGYLVLLAVAQKRRQRVPGTRL